MTGSGTFSNPYFISLTFAPWILTVNYNNVIPVEITSFEGMTAGDGVLLEWSTLSESNNMGFEIERSKGDENTWERIGYVAGKGTTSEKQNYYFKDSYPSTGRLLYRLKQIDFDGSFTYSGTVNIDLPVKNTLLNVHPNPFNAQTTIVFVVNEPMAVSLNVFNIIGERTAVLFDEYCQPGAYSVEFNASSNPSGIYFLTLIAGNEMFVKKLLVLK